MAGKPWTPAEDEQVRALYPHTSTARIAALIGRTASSVYQRAYLLGLEKTPEYLSTEASGRIQKGLTGSPRTRFKPGQVPFNKGRKMAEYMTPEGLANIARAQFRKGNKPHNTKWDFYERTSVEGYVEIRVSEGHFQLKHRWLWEQHHGPIPEGCAVVFRDGNKQNITIENLELLTRAELMARNTIARYPEEIRDLIKLNSKLKKTIKQHEK